MRGPVRIRWDRESAQLCGVVCVNPQYEPVFLDPLPDNLLSAAAVQCGDRDEKRHVPGHPLRYLSGLLLPDAGQAADPGVRDCMHRILRSLFGCGMYSCVSVRAEDIQAEGVRGKALRFKSAP